MLTIKNDTLPFLSLMLGGCLLAQGCGADNPVESGGNVSSGVPSGSSVSSIAAISSAASVPSSVMASSEAGVSSQVMQSSQAGSSSSAANVDEVLVCGDLTQGITAGRLNAAGKAHILCLHNQTRSNVALGMFDGLNTPLDFATDMKRLQWDDKLAQVAGAWANRCVWEHNANRTNEYNALSPTDINGNVIGGRESVGENLAFMSASNATAVSFPFATRGYGLWEEEGAYYSYGDLQVSDYCAQAPCGHFTQLIWATTYKVGCEVNFCAANTLSRYPATYLVCNYASAGNYIGRAPYQSSLLDSDVCSDADNGQSVCRQGLTESPDYQTGL